MLSAKDVAVFRGERLVFSDFSFSVAAGGALVLTGPNGSGKSTLLRLLAGLIRPAAGRLVWDGADAFADVAEHGRRVAYVGHQDAVKPGLTVAENLRFSASVSGRSIGAALSAVGLQTLSELPARMLSAGQRRRLALSRLLLSAAPLWLLDEPSLGLDRAAIERLGGLLATHRAGGGVVVAATHVALPLSGAAELRLDHRFGLNR
ncbi:heme ABC exporter ATP-binding protein CcmA [Rhodopila sp.]|uniref:heme ABC exporter ATP-binding protein CcmA n=1 Tax=Rhodopila sp. TaxID=2480087 RepID=UPI003D0DDA97